MNSHLFKLFYLMLYTLSVVDLQLAVASNFGFATSDSKPILVGSHTPSNETTFMLIRTLQNGTSSKMIDDNGRCLGSPRGCSSYSSSLSCNGQSGCAWRLSRCSGFASSCSFTSEPSCWSQDGCYWSSAN